MIDEAHERTLSIDIILGLVKQLLKRRKDFKVVVTSASMDTQLFKNYFQTDLLKVSGRMYPVQEVFWHCEETNFKHKIERLIDQEILETTSKMAQKYAGHVLTFCTGVDEINELVTDFFVESARMPRRFLQVTTRVTTTNVYGFGEHVHPSLRHSFKRQRSWPIFARDQWPEVSHFRFHLWFYFRCNLAHCVQQLECLLYGACDNF